MRERFFLPLVLCLVPLLFLNSTENWIDAVAIIPRTYWATEIIGLYTIRIYLLILIPAIIMGTIIGVCFWRERKAS